MTLERRKAWLQIAAVMLAFPLFRLLYTALAHFLILPNVSSEALQRFLRVAATLPQLLIAVLVWTFSKGDLSGFGFQRQDMGLQVLTGLGLGAGLSAVFVLLPRLLGLDLNGGVTTGYSGPWETLYRLAYYLLVIGFVEEFAFRGFVLHKLQRLYGSAPAVDILCSVCFGLVHFPDNVLFPALTGAFFCFCRRKLPHCSLVSLMLAHGLFDWFLWM